MQRIGHGGASAIAPANTLDSFDAARALGVDVIEFDVRVGRGELILAHTILDARRGHCLTLDRALRHLSGPSFGGLELNVDLKHAGCEGRLLDALRRHHLLERTLISSQVVSVLDRVRAHEPRARLAISVGGRAARVSRRWRDWHAGVLDGIARDRWHALMAQHRLVDQALQAAVSERGGRLYAWTVNELAHIERLAALEIDGVVTADPRLFGLATRQISASCLPEYNGRNNFWGD